MITKNVQLAANIQTPINFYGYRNVLELGEAVDMASPGIGWIAGISS